jgi:hypothetical protein
MQLREEYLFGGAFKGPPALDLALEGPQLTVGISARETDLKVVKERLRFKTRDQGKSCT